MVEEGSVSKLRKGKKGEGGREGVGRVTLQCIFVIRPFACKWEACVDMQMSLGSSYWFLLLSVSSQSSLCDWRRGREKGEERRGTRKEARRGEADQERGEERRGGPGRR